MSRIGKLPIPVPGGVDVQIDGREITVKGPKGELRHTVVEPIEVAGEAPSATSDLPPTRTARARWSTAGPPAARTAPWRSAAPTTSGSARSGTASPARWWPT